MFSEFIETFLTMVFVFQYLIFFVGFVFFIYPIHRFDLPISSRQYGVIFFCIGALHLYTVFGESTEKMQNSAVSMTKNFEYNQVDLTPYTSFADKACADGVLRMHEYRSFTKLVRDGIDDAVDKNKFFDIHPSDKVNNDFCSYMKSNHQQG